MLDAFAILLPLLGVLAVAAGWAGINWLSARSAPTRGLGYEIRGTSAGGSPDYALTGDYWPVGYWAVYWPLYSSGGGVGGRGGHLLGDGLLTAGRGLL